MTHYNEDLDGVLINNFTDYKNYVIKHISDHWINSIESELYEIFGKPKRYPFIFIKLRGDPEPDWGPITKEHVKVYY
jgi:hypothetical protein